MTSDSFPLVWASGVRQLVNHLWQCTLFLSLIAVLAILLRKNHARIRYGLWLAASIKFLIPFALFVNLGSLLLTPGDVAGRKNSAYVVVQQISKPFLAVTALDSTSPVLSQKRKASYAPSRFPPALLFVIWLSGFIATMIFWYLQWWRVSKLVASARPQLDGREANLLCRAERLAGLTRSIPLLLTSNSMEPGIFGIIRPVLLWPEGIASRMDDAHLESILMHEVCHVRRWDNLTSAIHLFVEAIFWFHPFVWWIERQLVKERERACDESVLRLGSQAGVYAESILDVCRFYTRSPIVSAAGVTGSELKQRITRILSQQPVQGLDPLQKAALGVAFVLTLGIPLTAGALNAAQGLTPSAEGELPRPLEATVNAPAPKWVIEAGGTKSFDTASVKENRASGYVAGSNFPLGPGDVYVATNGVFSAKALPLLDYIAFAYKIGNSQKSSVSAQLPDWAGSARYDIEARTNQSDTTKDQMRLMMQSLLAERFRLKIHTVTRESPVFALVLANSGGTGPQLRRHLASDNSCSSVPSEADSGMYPVTCGGVLGMLPEFPGDTRAAARSITMDAIASFLSGIRGGIDRPVVDRTGLTGEYDFNLEWAPMAGMPLTARRGAARSSSGPSAAEALKKQLGLGLNPILGLVEWVVIDRLDQPAANGRASGLRPERT